MEIDVGYAGIYIGYVYYSIQRYNSILKESTVWVGGERRIMASL